MADLKFFNADLAAPATHKGKENPFSNQVIEKYIMRTNLRMTCYQKVAIQQKLSLMIPGPTPVPEKVLQALSKHPIEHRSKEFQDLVESTTKNLQWLHQTQNDVLTITGSGTATNGSWDNKYLKQRG